MTTKEVKKAIETKINEIDVLKLQLTEIIFNNPNVIEDDEAIKPTNGYVGSFKVVTDKKTLKFAVNEKCWLTSFDNYLVSVEEMPCIKNFVIINENECLKRKVNELEEVIAKLVKCAN